MRKIITLVILLSTALSCENSAFLDPIVKSQISPETLYTREDYMRQGLIGCYETITTKTIPGKDYVQYGSYSQGLWFSMNYPCDDVVSLYSLSAETAVSLACFDESSSYVRMPWKVMYAGINRCNTLIYSLDRLDGMDEATKLQYKAEAAFLRAFFYYHLAWMYGGVPIVEYGSEGKEARSSLKAVYSRILDDFEYAEKNLAESGLLGVSATTYTASAYIARICNYLAACKRYRAGAQYWNHPENDFSWVDENVMSQKALTAARRVVEHDTHILVPDYRTLFLETEKATLYKESLFTADQPLSSTEGYWPSSFYFFLPGSAEGYPQVWGGRHVPHPRLFYMYHPDDIRRDWNCTGACTQYEEWDVNGYTYPVPVSDHYSAYISVDSLDVLGNPVYDSETGEKIVLRKKADHPLYDRPSQSYIPVRSICMCCGKYRTCLSDQVQRGVGQISNSIPLMRKAEVYLMYAEALYFTGSEALARDQFDVVLRRVAPEDALFNTLKAYYHRDDFVEELLESRERELCFEFSRKYDLIRFGRIDNAIASMDDEYITALAGTYDMEYITFTKGGYIQAGTENLKANWMPHKIWYPISEEQKGVNHALVQNPGW